MTNVAVWVDTRGICYFITRCEFDIEPGLVRVSIVSVNKKWIFVVPFYAIEPGVILQLLVIFLLF